MITLGKEHVGRVLYSRGQIGRTRCDDLVPFRVVAVGPVYASIEWIREGSQPIPEKLHRVTGQTEQSRRSSGNNPSYGRKFYESVEQYEQTQRHAAAFARVRVVAREWYLTKIDYTIEELGFLEKALTEPGFLAGKLEELKK